MIGRFLVYYMQKNKSEDQKVCLKKFRLFNLLTKNSKTYNELYNNCNINNAIRFFIIFKIKFNH